jgi:peptidyl-prolyl cis-trans isomerase C
MSPAEPAAFTPSLPGLLRTLHRRGRLLPLLREAVAEEACVTAAREANLAVTEADLQCAADAFRRRHGLATADSVHAWLTHQALTKADFEAALERDLLVERFKDRLAAEQSAAHLDAHRDRFARAKLRQLVVASDGLAHELLHQARDDGADFADLARRHSLARSREQGGDLGVVCRATLAEQVATAVFAADGEFAGPLLAEGGYHLYQVRERLPAELDEPTAAIVRQELFTDWLRQRLASVSLRLDWLEGPNGGR